MPACACRCCSTAPACAVPGHSHDHPQPAAAARPLLPGCPGQPFGELAATCVSSPSQPPGRRAVPAPPGAAASCACQPAACRGPPRCCKWGPALPAAANAGMHAPRLGPPPLLWHTLPLLLSYFFRAASGGTWLRPRGWRTAGRPTASRAGGRARRQCVPLSALPHDALTVGGCCPCAPSCRRRHAREAVPRSGSLATPHSPPHTTLPCRALQWSRNHTACALHTTPAHRPALQWSRMSTC